MKQQQTTPRDFAEILIALSLLTGRVEASFASKLVATYAPEMPVIDAVVLGNIGLALPPKSHPNRLGAIEDLYKQLGSLFAKCLKSPTGSYLVRQFKAKYPEAEVTEAKMLDLVLWTLR